MSDLKGRLLQPRVPEGEVVLEVGTVRVRGLSRGEVFGIQQLKGTEAQERRSLALAMLDPEMSESEVRQWQQSSPAGEMESVMDKIKDLSGLGEKSDKDAMASFRDESDAGVRVLPSDEAAQDGGATPGTDVE